MGILAFLLLGLLAGAIARMLMPGDSTGGFVVTMLLGVVGAFLGGLIGGLLFDVDPIDEFFDVSTWVAAIGGSVGVQGVFRLIAGRDDARRHDLS